MCRLDLCLLCVIYYLLTDLYVRVAIKDFALSGFHTACVTHVLILKYLWHHSLDLKASYNFCFVLFCFCFCFCFCFLFCFVLFCFVLFLFVCLFFVFAVISLKNDWQPPLLLLLLLLLCDFFFFFFFCGLQDKLRKALLLTTIEISWPSLSSYVQDLVALGFCLFVCFLFLFLTCGTS